MPTTTAPLPTASPLAPSPRLAILGLALWGLAALLISTLGLVTLERPFLIPLGLAGSVIALVVLYQRSPSLHALADGVDLRVPILFHAIRAPIGLSFLFLIADGLDANFARLGGYGDILSGSLAIVAAAFVGKASERLVVRAWNVVALVDIVLTVLTAQRILLFSDHPETMTLLTRFPFAMLPLYVVPLVIATHLLVFRRTQR